MRAVACTGAGFLLAVLWFDLMFDVQARRHATSDVPSEVRASIAAYYARVTTAARPMNQMVAAIMVVTIAALGAELAADHVARWRSAPSLALVLCAVGLASARTVRNAQRLGGQADDAVRQSQLAHSILRDHLFCIVAIGATLALQLPNF
jgi:hypothetical protein